jgi:hypothetical protein
MSDTESPLKVVAHSLDFWKIVGGLIAIAAFWYKMPSETGLQKVIEANNLTQQNDLFEKMRTDPRVPFNTDVQEAWKIRFEGLQDVNKQLQDAARANTTAITDLVRVTEMLVQTATRNKEDVIRNDDRLRDVERQLNSRGESRPAP